MAAYFPLFHHLDQLPLEIYDESRLAMSAVEMVENGQFLVPHYDGKPDLWSTKPPLMIIIQATFVRLFGEHEVAIRLPAALATLATLLLLIFFSARYLKNPLLGLFAALILLTSSGYITTHVARTGDYDALVNFFNLSSVLTFFLSTEASEKSTQRRYLLLTTLCIILAVLTKSVVGLMFLPAFFCWLIYRKKLASTLRSKAFFQAFLLFLGGIGSYYGYREWVTPGYLEAVYQNELGGRYLTVLEEHQAPFWWYVDHLISSKFFPWILVLPLSILAGFRQKGQQGRLLALLFLVSSSFLIFISLAQTKLRWYDSPVYPLLALIAAFGLSFLLQKLPINATGKVILACAIFALPYANIFEKNYLPKSKKESEAYGLLMRKNEQIKTYFLAYSGYNSSIKFYQKTLRKKGFLIEQKYEKHFEVADTVLFCEQAMREKMTDRYAYRVLMSVSSCELVVIDSLKKTRFQK